MPRLPWDEIYQVLVFVLVPALSASFVVMAVVRGVGRQRLAPLAAALALVIGVADGNLFRGALEWQLPGVKSWTWESLCSVLGMASPSLASSRASDESDNPPSSQQPVPLPPPRIWLPWVAGTALMMECVMSLLGWQGLGGWLPRALLALIAGRLLTPPDWHAEMPALPWLCSAAILGQWFVLAKLTALWQDGTTAATMAGCCLAAGTVLLLQADSARYMDMALFGFAALMGLALVAWVWPSNTSPAVAAAATFLPGLLLIGYHDISREIVPAPRNFLLVALAPLALLPMLLPALAGQTGWKRWLPGIVLPLLPALWAVIDVLRTESLDFD